MPSLPSSNCVRENRFNMYRSLSPVNEFYGQSRGPGMPGPYSVSLLYHTSRTKAKQPVHALLAEQ